MRSNKGDTKRVLSVRERGNVYTKRPNTRSQEDASKWLYAQSRFFEREGSSSDSLKGIVESKLCSPRREYVDLNL